MSGLRPLILIGLLALATGGGYSGHPATPEPPAPTPTAEPAPTPPPAEVYGCGLPRGQGRGWGSFSDQYQIVSSDNFIIRGRPSYRATCIPAWDAIPPAGDDS
jgi:hypothetical protein